MSNKSVAICGVARDCSVQLNKLIPKLENLGTKFNSYKIIVVENDSKDETAEVILAWAAKNQNVTPILFSENKEISAQQNMEFSESRDFCYSRISRIAYARNLYLRELCNYQKPDYVIVIDLDIMDFSIKGIANSFEHKNQWDCVTSSGLRYTLRSPFIPAVYWDTYAYEPIEGYSGGVQHLADIRFNQKYLWRKLKSNEFIPAVSAFGGLAIYRTETLTGQRYEVLENNDSKVPIFCEHVSLHRAISRATKGFRLVINPSQKLLYETRATTIRRSFRSLLTK